MQLSPLVPDPPRPVHELLAEVRPRERAPEDRPFLFLNMVMSADGRATLDGRAGGLGGDADLSLLLELRAFADAVLIGTGTVRVEGYDRLVRAEERRERRIALGLPPDPLAVLLTRGTDVPWNAGLFAAPAQPVLVYTGGDVPPPAVAAPVEVVPLPDPTPAAALADLRARGVRALLCEGGPTLNRSLLTSGLVDELFLTLSPMLTGDSGALGLVEGARLPVPAPLELRWALQHGDELLLRYGVE